MDGVWRSVTDQLDVWHFPLLLLTGAILFLRFQLQKRSGHQAQTDKRERKTDQIDDGSKEAQAARRAGPNEIDVLLIIVMGVLVLYPLTSKTYCQNVKCKGYDRLAPKGDLGSNQHVPGQDNGRRATRGAQSTFPAHTLPTLT